MRTGAAGGDINANVGFHVDEADVAEEIGFEFLGGECLDEDDVVLAITQAFDAFFVSIVGEKVGDDDDEAGALGAHGEAREGGIEVGFSAGFEVLEVFHEAQDAGLAAHGAGRGSEEGVVFGIDGQGGEGDFVGVGQGDVGDRGGEAAAVVELEGVAVVHGEGGVEEDVDGHFLLFHKEPEHERFKFRVRVPVDAAEVVSLNVGAEIGEFDGGAVDGGAALAAGVAAEKLARGEGEHLELFEEGRIEEGVGHFFTAEDAGDMERIVNGERGRRKHEEHEDAKDHEEDFGEPEARERGSSVREGRERRAGWGWSSGGAAYLFEEVAFVEFDFVALEEFEEFFFEGAVAVVFRLVADVGEELVLGGFRDGEGGVFGLPGEGGVEFFVDPARRVGFHGVDEVGDGEGGGDADIGVEVVGDAAGDEEFAVEVFADAVEVAIEFGLPFGEDAGLAVVGGPDQVDSDMEEGGHVGLR